MGFVLIRARRWLVGWLGFSVCLRVAVILGRSLCVHIIDLDHKRKSEKSGMEARKQEKLA